MNDFTPAQDDAIRIAHELVELGAPVFAAPRNHSAELTDRMPFHLPNGWEEWKPSHKAVDRWRPGMALAMVCGVVYDVVDVDPRNGGNVSNLPEFEVYGSALTPSDGNHFFIPVLDVPKGKLVGADGIDLQAGTRRGEGRGFVFLAPTERVSRYGRYAGDVVPYTWKTAPQAPGPVTTGHEAIRDMRMAKRPSVRLAPKAIATASEDDDFDLAEDWTADNADRVIQTQLDRVQAAQAGDINNTLGGAARVLGRFVGGGYLDEERAAGALLHAIEAGGVHSDAWNIRNGLGWTAASVIQAGLTNGQEEPWTVAVPVPVSGPPTVTPGADAPAVSVDTSVPDGVFPRLMIQSPAVMAYWLVQAIGTDRLAGFFTRGGQIVHTPRVSELGYVPAPEGDDNGPAEIRPVTADTLAAKLQFLYACYKEVRDKETKETREVPAMFPAAAAKVVVNAPESATGLRPLNGITHTPMVRADGTVLDTPGYDKASGYLFLPGPGVRVPSVPEHPSLAEVQSAVAVLCEMVEGFPFAGDDDRANYLGLLLTPLMRLVTPPSYKMFGISAHQPGSGKSLLAEIVGLIHGAVMRSETPEDEAEWRKMTMSLLSTTSAPAVVLDNVTGILRSSTLAGLLTASGEIQDRELGSSRMITTSNDRVWVVTGNNLSLGGDLVRRTITILIDPDMANPETRTGFKIQDLPAWVKVNRNRLLHALLVMIRHWVACGMPLEDRRQSDGFATWERAVGGILKAASVPGRFDAESGKRAAAGGDDDGLATLLEHLHEIFGDEGWTVAQALTPRAGEYIESDRDWLPAPVLDKFSRGEARGKQAMGKWLRFRLGRWVTGSDGCAYVLRELGTSGGKQTWKVERR